MGPPHGYYSIVPDVGINLTLSFVTDASSLWTMCDLLDRNSKGSSLGVRHDKSGRSSLNDLVRHSGSFLADAGQGLILPCPQLGVQLLVKLRRHLCKERHKQDASNKFKKKRVCQHQKLTFVFLGYCPQDIRRRFRT